MSVLKFYFVVTCVLIFVTFPGATFASKCFEKSSLINEGADIYSDQVIPALQEKDFRNMQEIFKAAKGFWEGEMSVRECFGTPASLKVKSETYEVKAAMEFDGRKFNLNMDLYSPTSKSGKTTELEYYLTEESFKINPRKSGKAEVLDSTPAGVRYYKRFRQSKAGQDGTFVNESYFVFELSESTVAFREYQYHNGELVLESVTELKRK